MKLNLNADLGESFGPWPMGDDERLLAIVNSANVACGFHAGDPLVMRATIQEAKRQGVSIGAHPGFPDLQGFGRRQMQMTPDELHAAVLYQLAALGGMCTAAGIKMTHVKPHGALNNMACEDINMSTTICDAIRAFNEDLILLAPVLSELARAGESAGLRIGLEIFADRTYTDTGSLTPRRLPGSVISNSDECIAHVRNMIDAGGVVSTSGKVLKTPFHSICVHGDNAHAVDTAKALSQALQAQGHKFMTLPDIIA